MKIARVEIGGEQQIAISDNAESWWLLSANQDFPWLQNMKSLMERWSPRLQEQLFEAATRVEGPVQFLCPLQAVEKIVCVGKNYADHALEMGGERPDIPVIFNKFPTSLIGPDEAVVLPAISDKVDYEAELVVVIGKEGRRIGRANALAHVFGYTIGNDVTARDWQKGRPGGQWLLGKTFDTFAPIGPHIVTADSIDNPHSLDIEMKLNGQTMQVGNTSELIFPIDVLIEHISKFFTLRTGDLLFTGTPAGVGAGREPEVYLKPGDKMDVSISGIGTLTNSVVADEH